MMLIVFSMALLHYTRTLCFFDRKKGIILSVMVNDFLGQIKKRIRLFLREEVGFFSVNSLILILSSLWGGFLNYWFHFFTGRMLGPEDYGTFSSLLSLFYIFSVPMGTFSLVAARFSADDRKSKYFFRKSKRWIEWFSLFFFLFFLVFIPLISSFLHFYRLFPLILTGLFLSLSFLVNFKGAVLQGRLKFTLLAINSTIGAIIKLFLAVIFIYWGMGVNGAIWAMLLANFFSYFYFSYFLERNGFFSLEEDCFVKEMAFKEIWTYIWRTFLFVLSFTLLYNIDIILARHFLSSCQMGWYGALSTLGKIIYFLANPLAVILFPMVIKKRSEEKNSDQIFRFSFLVTIFIALCITCGYFVFPRFILKIFYGENFLPAARYLGWFAVFLSFYSFSYLFGNFIFSQKKNRVAMFFPFWAVLLQVVLIWFFHDDIASIIIDSIFANILLFFSFFVYYIKVGTNEN